MRKLLWTLIVSVVMVEFLSCSDNNSAVPPDIAQVKNVQWRLISYDSLGGRTITLSSTDSVLLFLEETRIARGTSHGQCGNKYSGVHSSSGASTLRFDSLSSTEMACSSTRYWEFFGYLPEVTSFGIGANRLYLYFNSGARKLTFERTP